MEKQVKSICVVSPFPPPYGGMAIQAENLVKLLKKSSFEVIPVRTNADFPKSINLLAGIKGIRTLLNLIFFLKSLHKALVRVQVVYLLTGFFNFFFWVTYPALLLIRIHGKKAILNAHGGAAELFFQKYGLLVKPILKTVNVVTTPSGFLKDVFEKAFDIKAKVIPNITDLDQFRFRDRPSVDPKLLVTRSLEKIYNVQCVIKAFRIVHEYFPGSTLGIVGGGSERPRLEKLASRLGLSDCIQFYGRVDNTVIQDIYDQYDIFVNASNVDNLPLTILEAFACGLPVVSTKAGGIPYMVEDSVTGLLVEMEDYKGLATKVIELVKDSELSLWLSRNARAECENYSEERVKSLLFPLLIGEIQTSCTL